MRAVGVADRDDFYWTLHAVFVNRFPHRELFDQAFHVFWRNPRLLERMMSMLLPGFNYPAEGSQPALRRRLGDALQDSQAGATGEPSPAREIDLDAALSWSAREVLKDKDFEQMSSDEIARAKSAVAGMGLLLAPVPVRGRRNEPSFVAHTVASLAAHRGVSTAELAARTTANATVLFGLGLPDGGGA